MYSMIGRIIERSIYPFSEDTQYDTVIQCY